MSNQLNYEKNGESQNEIQHGLAALLTFAAVTSGLVFVAWFHWALVMRLAAF